MTYAVILGSDIYVNTSGVLSVRIQDERTGELRTKEFFKVSEVDRKRSSGSYLVVDCDIRDSNGDREVKLDKSRPRAIDSDLQVTHPGKAIEIRRSDGSLVIKVEEVDRDDPAITNFGFGYEALVEALEQVESILRITGDFHVGRYHVRADTTETKIEIETARLSRNLKIGGGAGLILGPDGISF